jgi:vacuolar-type H+-ATPase subunit D/Vma8
VPVEELTDEELDQAEKQLRQMTEDLRTLNERIGKLEELTIPRDSN